MVGVAERPGDDGPGSVPALRLLINENPHQLRYGNRGVRVVELDRDLVLEVFPRIAWIAEVPPNDVPERARHEEVLLNQPQFLTVLRLVIRVKHLGDRFTDGLLVHRLDIAARIEGGQVEVLGRPRGPKPQEVDGLGSESCHRDVVGHSQDGLRVHPAGAGVAAVIKNILHAAVEAHLLGVLGANDLPRVAKEDPAVGVFHLVSVDELLLEQPELVMDAVSESRKIQGRQGIEETRREPSEASVAEAHVDLRLAHRVKIDPEGTQRRPGRLIKAGRQQVAFEEPAHQVLHREVIQTPDVLGIMNRLGLDHALMNRVPYRKGRRHPPVARSSRRGISGERRR